MQDEFHGRLWEAHHDRFSADVDTVFRKAAARLRAIPFIAERIAGQILVGLAAVSVASTLTLTTGLA